MEDDFTTTTAPTRTRRFGAQFFLTILLILAAAGAGAGIMYMTQVKQPREQTIDENRQMQLSLSGSTSHDGAIKLADKFTDADGDMIADPPADASQLIDPPTLLFCYIAQEEEEKYQEEWKPFCDHLSKVTGKPVEYVLIRSVEDQLKAMEDGKLHASGFNTGAVPIAVNKSGFVPVARIPTVDASGTHVEIIVPASSSITKLEDLRGRHELTLTDPSSNSGYKAPMVLLKSEHSLEPERDYLIRMSSGHERSIEGIANGQYQAAAVAADLLARAESTGLISKDKYRSIYKSASFPSAALGYVYNLKPELAAKVKEAIATFDNKGTPLEAEFGSEAPGKFVPVKYKDEWALIRRIDDESAKLRAVK